MDLAIGVMGGIIGALVTALVGVLVALWRGNGRRPHSEPNPHDAGAFPGDLSVEFWKLAIADILREVLKEDRKALIAELRKVVTE